MISVIRQHRTICHAAKFVLTLGFVLLGVQGHGFDLSYWDAILKIGYNSKTQSINATNACRQIERLAGFRKAIRELPVFDEQLNNQIQQIESQISSFDAGNLYDQLPYSETSGKWRGIGIRGGLDAEFYRLGIVDPEVENWVKTASTELPKPWRPQEQFGDFGLKAFARPVKKDTYRLATEGQIYIKDLNPANFIRIVEGWVGAMSWFSENGADTPSKFFKDSGLNASDRRVVNGLVGDFPHLFKMLDQFFTIDDVVADRSNRIDGSKSFNLAIRIRVSAFKNNYPHIGKLLHRLKGVLDFQATLFDNQNRPLGRMTFDGNQYLFSIQFRTQGNRFLLSDHNLSDVKTTGVSLTESGRQHFDLLYSFGLNIVGLKIKIEGLRVNLDYYFDDHGAYIKAKIRQPPKDTTVEGLILGFLPIWLIDFFIPSNIEDMTRQFFQTLAFGNNGDGVFMDFRSIPAASTNNTLRLVTDAEVLSNGTIKFAHNLQRQMIREEKGFVDDIKRFEQQLWEAFYLDFSRIKSLGFCGE